MTLAELQIGILRCSCVSECDDYLTSVLDEVRPLFYGRTLAELCSGYKHFEYENAILAIVASPVGRSLTAGAPCPKSITALLIFFISFFERVRLFGAIYTVASLLPSGHLRHRAEAIFLYKNITDARIDFQRKFGKILDHLQAAWDQGDVYSKQQCVDLLQEYYLDAIIETRNAGADISSGLKELFLCSESTCRYPILNVEQVKQTVGFEFTNLARCRAAIRSRIVESFHAEACRFAPQSLLSRPLLENDVEYIPSAQPHCNLPDVLDKQLRAMGARYEKQRGNARTNFDADPERNRVYLGTFLPRTVIESWNIFSDLLSMPVVDAAFSQKEAIRILDIGSGTGGAVIGFLLALNSWGRCTVPVEITSVDVNADALNKQGVILDALIETFSFPVIYDLRVASLPFELDGFVPSFSAFADAEGPRFDIVTCWKCLCEFYNVNFAQAQGIVRHALTQASRMLVPYGLCVAADVTTLDNNIEYFSMTLNREANEHDQQPGNLARTVLPVPCAGASNSCPVKKCFTQRRFNVSHSLAPHDSTKIAYRVLATADFATSITSGFREQPAFRVNAARPLEACFKGVKREMHGDLPCGYTGFF